MAFSADKIYPQPVMALNGATAAATPPTYNSGLGWGLVPDSWKGGAVEEFDVVVYADASNAVTLMRLVAGRLVTVTLADDDVDTVDTTDNELDIASHAYVTGDGPVRLTTSGTIPGGLATGTDYWVVVVNSGAIKLSESFELAIRNKTIDITSSRPGTNTVADLQRPTDDDKNTRRVHWCSMGYLGEANDGSITLTSAMAWVGRARHSHRNVVYSAVATFGTATATYVILRPCPIIR